VIVVVSMVPHSHRILLLGTTAAVDEWMAPVHHHIAMRGVVVVVMVHGCQHCIDSVVTEQHRHIGLVVVLVVVDRNSVVTVVKSLPHCRRTEMMRVLVLGVVMMAANPHIGFERIERYFRIGCSSPGLVVARLVLVRIVVHLAVGDG
jgi:hypothetical protein